MIQDISKIEKKEIIKGFSGRFFHTNNFTIAFWEIEEGSLLPVHSHIHEQTTQVIEGKLEMFVDGVTTVLEPGMIANIPSNVIHSGKALTNCKVTDVFSPTREDYK
ncbi:MAG: cupin domain-containing protein [Lutibacter sp.]|nr:cupin domain-containing protein [Lutibacter sp.]MDT8417351.1 cupin domain-containing protein [Lutibacter sp.]